jgi:hypothetical protein
VEPVRDVPGEADSQKETLVFVVEPGSYCVAQASASQVAGITSVHPLQKSHFDLTQTWGVAQL